MPHTPHTSIERLIAPTAEAMEAFMAGGTKVVLPKKGHLLRYQEVADAAYFIEEGLLRVYTVLEGEEHTSQFFFEGAWMAEYQSFLTQLPTICYIQALEPTVVWRFERAHIYSCYDQYPEFERFGRYMAEQAYLGLQKRTQVLANQSPELRYQNLIKERPKVIERVSLKHIASYLGITAESLSRIRRRGMERDAELGG
jgi:CRP-like cAMP-binding protein